MMKDLLDYLEQVGTSTVSDNNTIDPRPIQEINRQSMEGFGSARREMETNFNVEDFAKGIQGAAEQSSNLVSERSNWRAVGDVAAGVTAGVYGTVVGGSSLFLNPDAINAMRAPLEALENAKSPQARNQMEYYNRETALYNRTIEDAIMSGRISNFDGQVLIGKNSFKSMNAGTAEAFMSTGAGSVAFLIGMTAFGGPAGAAAGWTAMGASTLAAPVDTILGELYKQDAMGNFEYTHEDLIDSSPVYQAAFEKTGNEEEARRALFNETRMKGVLSWENIGGTVIELFGERLMLKMSGVLKSSKQMGGITSIPKNVTKALTGEIASEVTGDTGSAIGANVAIRDTFDATRDRLEGVGENIPASVIGAAGGVGTTMPGMVLTSTANTLAGRGRGVDPDSSDGAVEEAGAITDSIDTAIPPAPPSPEGTAPAAPDENTIEGKIQGIGDLFKTGRGKEIPESLRAIAGEGEGQSRIKQIQALYKHATSGNATPEEVVEIGKVLQEYTSELDTATNSLGSPDQIQDPELAQIAQSIINTRDKLLSNNQEMDKAMSAATDIATSGEVQRDESGKITPEGAKTVSNKLSLAPESLTEQDVNDALDMEMMPTPDGETESVEALFSESEREKLKFLRESLNKQRELDQQRADAGMNAPIDVVGRQVMSDFNDGPKGKSVLGHAMSIMDSMRNGNLNDAKTQMADLRRFIASHANKLNALEKAVAAGEKKANYKTYSRKKKGYANKSMEVKGKAENLRRSVAQELAFMEDTFNRLATTYEGIGKPVKPNTAISKLFPGSSAGTPDTRTPAARITESTQGSRPAPNNARHTPESAQLLSNGDLYRMFNNLDKIENRNPAQQANHDVLRNEVERREDAIIDGIQSIEKVAEMTKADQREYLRSLTTIPTERRDEELTKYIEEVVKLLNSNESAPSTPTPDASAPSTPAPTPSGQEGAPASTPTPAPESQSNTASPEEVSKVLADFNRLDLESSEKLINNLGTEFFSKLFAGNVSPSELAFISQRINAYLNSPTPPTPPTPPSGSTTTPSTPNPSTPAPPATPDATPSTPEGTPEATSESTPADAAERNGIAKSIFEKTKIAKAMNIVAEKTKLYTPRFLTELVQSLGASSVPSDNAFAQYIAQHRGRITTMLGAYDEMGNPTPGTMLDKIHNAMDRQLIYNLGDSPSKLKILEDLIKPYIGKQTVQEWMSQNMPKVEKTEAGRNQGRAKATKAIRDLLVQNMDEAAADRAMNQLKADLLARNSTHRMLDLMTYDPETNQFNLDARVLNAAALAITDYIGNFKNYTESFSEIGDIEKALGIVKSGALITKFGNENVEISSGFLASRGYTTLRRAVGNMARTANDLLGMRGKSNAGEGDIYSPMQNLIVTFVEGLNDVQGLPNSFEIVRVTNDNGIPFPILIPYPAPDESSMSAEEASLENLKQAGDLGITSVLEEPERIRYIDQVPKKRNTDKQGNNLTRKQADALDAANKIGMTVNPKPFNLFTKVLGKAGLIKAFGNPEALDENSPMSKLDRESKNGKNIQVINALAEALGIETEVGKLSKNLADAVIHYAHTYSSVNRLMMEGGYNPQADKIIRALVSPHKEVIDASTFIDFLATGSMENSTDAERFLTLAYAQALGVSLQNRDMNEIKDDLNSILDTGLRDIAVEWATAAEGNEQANLDSLIERTQDKLGGDFSELAIQSLVEIGDILKGKDLGNFETHAYVEADGITNGPFMAGMLLGIQDFSADWVRFTSNAGLYIGREETSNDYRSSQIADPDAPRPDNYTAVTQEANVLVANRLNYYGSAEKSSVRQAATALISIFKHAMDSPVINADGQIEISRNVGKNPVTVTFYGSGVTGIASKFAGELEQVIYEIATAALRANTIEELAESVIKGDLSTAQKVEALNNLSGSIEYLTRGRLVNTKNGPVFATEGYGVNLLNMFQKDKPSLVSLRLKRTQLDNLKGNLAPTLVEPLVESLNGLAGSTLAGTETVQQSTVAFSSLLASVFKKEIAKLTSDPSFDPTIGLTRKDIQGIIDKLKHYGITDSIGDSIFSLIKRGGSIEGLEVPLNSLGNTGLGHMESTYRELMNLGVGGVPRFVISRGDGATIVDFFNRAIKEGMGNLLAVYDGINFGARNFETGSKMANDAVRATVTENPVLGLLNQLEKGMNPMLEELGFEPNSDRAIQFSDMKEAEALVQDLTNKMGDRAAAEHIVLEALKAASPRIRGANPSTLKEASVYPIEEPVVLVPRVAKSYADLVKLITNQAELEQWKNIHPVLGNINTLEDLKNRENSRSALYLEHPEGINSMFSLVGMRRLAKDVAINLEALNRFKSSIDQMAAVGQPSVSEGITLDTKDPQEIAAALNREAIKVRGESSPLTYEKPQSFKLDKEHWEKNDDGTYELQDYKAFRKILSSSFPAGDFRNNIAKRVVAVAHRLGVNVVIDSSLPGSFYRPSENTVYLNSPANTTALHELIHGVISRTLHKKYELNEKLSPSAEKALSELETILNDIVNDPNTLISPHWARAVAHMKRAGERARKVYGPQAVKGAMINEMLAIWLTDPALSADALSRSPRSKLRVLADKVLGFFRSTFGLPEGTDVDSLFMRMAFNMDALARENVGLSIQELSASSSPDLHMFDPDSAPMSEPMYRRFMDVVNLAEAHLREIDKDLSLEASLESVDSADIFKANGFMMNEEQERAFNQIRQVFTVSAKVDKEAKASMYRLAAHVFKNIKPEHFGDTSRQGSPSYHMAHNMHTAVTGSASGSREAMVINLIALATVNEEMKEVINKIGIPESEKTTETDSTWERVLGQFGYDSINKLSNYLAGVKKGDAPSEHLARLMETIEKKPEGESESAWTLPGRILDKANDVTSDLLTSLGNHIERAGSGLIENSESNAAKVSGGIIGAVGAVLSKDAAAGYAQRLNSTLNTTEHTGFLKDSIRDIIGRTELNAPIYDLIKVVRSHVQKLRQMYIEGVSNNVKNKFKNKPTQGQMNSLQRATAETDVAAVVASLGIDAAIDTLSSDAKVRRRIRQLETAIKKSADSNFILSKSEQLAHYMITGETGSTLLMNATHIVGKFGHRDGEVNIPGLDADLINTVDEYISLLAFEKSDTSTFREMLKNEPEAIRYILAVQEGIRIDELSKPGTDNKPLGIKGYISNNSAGSIRIIRDDMAQQYINKGYTRVGDYAGTSYDNNDIKRGYYVNMLDEARPFAQGIIQNVVDSVNGISVNGDPMTESLIPTGFDMDTITEIIEDGLQDTSKYGLVPIFDDFGNVVNLARALDPAVAREKNKDNDFAQNLGITRGRQIEENTADTVNKVIVDELDRAYENDTKKSEYVDLLKLDTKDPVLKDALAVLNKNAVSYSELAHGRMMVRKELLNNVVGYRQAGVADIWNGISRFSPKTRREIQKALESMIGPKAFKYMVQGEDTVRGLVADAKQLIVVKSIIVPAINGLSNIVHMVARGVPLHEIIRGIPRKLAEIEQYSQGMKRVIEIESEILASSSEPAKVRRLEAERASIIEHQKTLSIYPLIEAGEFSSIVSMQIDQESGDLAKGKVAEYIEKKINSLPTAGRTAASNLLITKDTAIYQFLQKSVDYGDFIAKAVVYDDIIKRQGKSPAYALGRIKEEFINYDYLPGRVRGALEANGLLWFFNFKMRSLKIALSMIRENPLTALMTIGTVPMSTPFGDLGLPLDDNILAQSYTGAAWYSVGPGMGFNAAMLHPLSALLLK